MIIDSEWLVSQLKKRNGTLREGLKEGVYDKAYTAARVGARIHENEMWIRFLEGKHNDNQKQRSPKVSD